jgi:integrase
MLMASAEEAGAYVEITKEEAAAEARPGSSGSGAIQSSRPHSLTSKSGQRTYDRAITDFVEWYCSEPRLSFNRTVVLRYRIFLEQKLYAPATVGKCRKRVAAGIRNYAILAMLIGCGLRRAKLLALRVESIQSREERWVIADLLDKAGHIRTVAIPSWVRSGVEKFMEASGITDGALFRSIDKRAGHGEPA